jgi:N-acetylglucosamine-6-phosphate deacetylase
MSGKKTVTIHHANIVSDKGIIENGGIRFIGEKIVMIGPSNLEKEWGAISENEELIDAKGGWVLPGFIDVHVHGGFGADFMDADKEAYDTITKFHGKHGTTGILATTVTAPRENIYKVLSVASDYMKSKMPYAELLGVHLEGPFISRQWPGAQNPQFIVPPNEEWVKAWTAEFPGLVRIVTLAPECEGALQLIEWLKENGIVASCGHTDASYDQIQTAVEKGLKHAVHTFNAMTGLHHRAPGTVGAVLSDDRISAEIIADGHHIHPACITILAKLKTADNLLLITDAISAAGLGDGQYNLGGLQVTVQDGIARLTEGNSLAGSTLTMIDAFRFVVEKVGLSVEQASRLASGNPAKLLGLEQVTGSLAANKQADIILASPELQIEKVWVKGTEIR